VAPLARTAMGLVMLSWLVPLWMLVSLAGIAVGGGFMLPFYALRGMSAGDVKLMGAVGSFLGTCDYAAPLRFD